MAEEQPGVPRRFQLFGLPIDSDTDLSAPSANRGPARLTVLRARAPLPRGTLLLRTRIRLPDGDTEYELARVEDGVVLRYGRSAEFLIAHSSIHYRTDATFSTAALQWLLLGPVIGFWFEFTGLTVLHGATVEVNGSAIAVLAGSGTGKSSLAVAFAHAGHRLLGDDHVVIDPAVSPIAVYPALPWLKVGPRVCETFGIDYVSLPNLHRAVDKRRWMLSEGQRVETSLPLRAVFVLDRTKRTSPEVRIESLGPRDALVNLIRHSYAPVSVHAAGFQTQRLALLSRIVSDLGIARVEYGEGLDRLSQVRRAIVAHVLGPKCTPPQ